MYIQGVVKYMYIIVYIHVSMNHCDKFSNNADLSKKLACGGS